MKNFKPNLTHLSTFCLLFFASYLILTRNFNLGINLVSADLLLNETIYQGFFLDHEPIHHFILMAAPDFLQLLLYCACRLILNMTHTIIAVTLLSLYLFYFLFLQIVKLISANPIEFKLYQGVILLGITLLAFSSFWPMDSFSQSLGFNDHFFNSAIMNLLALWLLLRILLTEGKHTLLFSALFISVFFTTLGDPSYLTCFVCPALCTLIFAFFYFPGLEKKILQSAMTILVSGFGGYFLLRHLPFFDININYNHLVNPWQRNLSIMGVQILHGLILLLIDNLPLFLLWIFSLIFLFKINIQNRAFSFIQIFIINLVIISFLALLLLDPDINPSTPIAGLNNHFFTHNSPVIYFPIFFMSVHLLQAYSSVKIQKKLATFFKGFIFILQIMILCILPSTFSLNFLLGNPQKNWPWVQCMQNIQKQYHLQQGIGDYWVSRPITLYTYLPMEQVNKNLHPNYWLTDTLTLQPKTADFVVLYDHRLQATTVTQKYGPPANILRCPFFFFDHASLQILIYPKGIPISHTTESLADS